jgi:hypothetical protein
MRQKIKFTLLSMGFLHAALIVVPQLEAATLMPSKTTKSDTDKEAKANQDRYHNRFYFRQRRLSSRQQAASDKLSNKTSDSPTTTDTTPNNQPHVSGANALPNQANPQQSNNPQSKSVQTANPPATKPPEKQSASATNCKVCNKDKGKQNASSTCKACNAFKGNRNCSQCRASEAKAHLFAAASADAYSNHRANPPLTKNAVRDEDNYYYFYRQPEHPMNLPSQNSYASNHFNQPQPQPRNNGYSNNGYDNHTANSLIGTNPVRDEDNYYYYYRQPERPTNLENQPNNAPYYHPNHEWLRDSDYDYFNREPPANQNYTPAPSYR